MKWGRKNKLTSSPSSSPSSSSIITRVFQVSWFSKFKQKLENPETLSKKNKSKNELDFSPKPRFFSMDEDDPYWRLAFCDEEISAPARRSTGGLMMNPARPDDFDHEFHFPVSRNFNDMVLDIKRMKEKENEQKMRMRGRDSRAKGSKREREIMQMKHKVKAYSPRTECKIRALEEMKRARMKMKREKRREDEEEEEQEQVVLEGKTVFNSFAVVRNSFDPQRDFRESMVEMIREKRIRGPDDLEELLACYLDLNSEEYHDVIIKVFCQVWFELRRVLQCFDN